jgi:nucleoside-diphosphate-sugar epimerase
MQLLITSAASPLAQFLANELAAEFSIRLTERTMVVGLAHEFAVSALGHDASTNLLVRGIDSLIHVVEPLPAEEAQTYMDYATRCTYNLLLAASQEHVRRVALLSTLDVMAGVDPRYAATERWRPRPSTEPHVLGRHLAEYVAREFARESKLTITVLRLGHLVDAHSPWPPDDEFAVAQEDVARAAHLALTVELPRWSVFHIAGDRPNPRFPIREARRVLGFAPQGAASGVK